MPYVLTIWLAFLAMHGYYFLLDYWNTPHPSYLPLLGFVAVQGVALLLAAGVGAWRLVRGPKRLSTAAWLSLGFLPVFLWYSQVSLSFHLLEDRMTQQVEIRWPFVTAPAIVAALLDGIGRWTLPLQLEGDRVVMFYDASITDPPGDLEKMDAFIKSEEAYLGITMPTKIHWVRNAPLGMEMGLALAWTAIAAPESDHTGEKRISFVDYHEVAHNVIPNRFVSSIYVGRYPPAFLTEGWAQSRSESWETLAEQCWNLKQSNQALTFREAVSDTYYNQTDYRLYQQGGALVKVLCDKFGPEKFLELYTTCTRKTFEQDVKRIYGLSFEELDSHYWEEIESLRNTRRSFDKATENCTPEEKALLEEFRSAYRRQVDDFYRLTENGTLEAVVRHSYHGPDRELEGQQEILFQAREGQLFLGYNKDTGTQTKASEENTEKVQWEGLVYYLLLPEERLYTYQHSSDKDAPSELVQRSNVSPPEREYVQQEFRRFHLRAFQPFSLFQTMSGHWFAYPDDYLWEPPIDTIIQSVTLDGNTVILTLTTPDRLGGRTLTLRMNRERDWLLLDAEARSANGEVIHTDIREYGESIDGVPLLKKRRVISSGPETCSTEEVELLRFDPASPSEDVFHEKNLPLSVPPRAAERVTVEQRL